jgi:predicted membrane protein
MPFNVLCLVCTVIAIFYGNAFTLTTKLYKILILFSFLALTLNYRMKPVPKPAQEDNKKDEAPAEHKNFEATGLKQRFMARLLAMFRIKPKTE